MQLFFQNFAEIPIYFLTKKTAHPIGVRFQRYLFLWRLAFRRLRYLCLAILARRFFLMEPTVFLLNDAYAPKSDLRFSD